MAAPSRTVLLAGATGLVGRELLQGLLADASVLRVIAVGRRAPEQVAAKLQFIPTDFVTAPALPPVDEAYIALGTTIKATGTQAAFRAVDFDAVVTIARAAKAAGARKLGVVSAMGASAKSNVFYSRVKGEAENALAGLRFDTLVIARPSMLAGDRTSVGQAPRRGEEIALKVSRWLGSVIPRNYQPIPAKSVAHALLQAVPASKGRRVMLSGELRD